MAKKLDNKDLEQVSGGFVINKDATKWGIDGKKEIVKKGSCVPKKALAVQPNNPINPVINPDPKQPNAGIIILHDEDDDCAD